jgi:GntR family transcriptional regulator
MLCIYDIHRCKEQILLIAISATNPDPMYKQVTDQIRDAIVTGSFAPDARLPSIREMAGELKISHITIKRAYGDLEREGYIIARPGLGSFVAGINRKRLKEAKLEELRKDVAKLAKDAEAFGITPAEIRRIVDEIKVKRK